MHEAAANNILVYYNIKMNGWMTYWMNIHSRIDMGGSRIFLNLECQKIRAEWGEDVALK